MSVRERLRGPRPLILGHRGDAHRCPENTLAAVRSAVDAGADGVEIDVHSSRDDVLVVIHDETLDRTTDGHGRVAGSTAADLRRLDAGSWRSPVFAGERIPLVTEVLDAVRGRGVVAVELKDSFETWPSASDSLLRDAADTGMLDDVMLLAFDHRHLVRARNLHPAATCVALVTGVVAEPTMLLDSTGSDALGPPFSLADADLCARVHRAGGAVVAWTVNDVGTARSLITAGVDALVTDDPWTMVLALNPR